MKPKPRQCRDTGATETVAETIGSRGAVPPAEPAAARAISPVKVSSEGAEVTQSIQNMPHDVPLVEGKRTIVRVYLSANAAGPIMVHGLLKARRRPSGAWHFIGSLGPVAINPAENGQLRTKRENESKSLNFLLPAVVCQAGFTEVRLAKLWEAAPAPLRVPPNARRRVRFRPTPPLRVRILGVRFQAGSPPANIEPSALDYTLIRSWLQRAYPVAGVEWSQTAVDAPQAWPFDASVINAFVRGIRTTDVLGGVDARTHYYGLVSEGSGGFFMRGLASGIPTAPDPSTVASGPTGTNTWGWDTDGSYGDWYTGHELGHTFGRFHAMFCGAAGGAPYPFINGQLSDADGAFVGLDTGDPASGLPLRALPGTMWHDVMTYCVFQWLSSFTYTGIRDRLIQEDALPASMAGTGAARARTRSKSAAGTNTIHVVATVNLTQGTGAIRHVTALPAVPVGAAMLSARSASRKRMARAKGPAISLRLYGKTGRWQAYPATLIPDACTNPGDDETGTIDALLPPAKNASRMELLLNDKVIDTFVPGPPPARVRAIRPAAPAPRRRGPAAEAVEDNPVLTWQETGTSRARGRGAAAAPPGRVYTVQVSIDGGRTWQTAGFGLRQPSVTIDRQLLGDAETVRVRITSTNGFERATTEQTLKVDDL